MMEWVGHARVMHALVVLAWLLPLLMTLCLVSLFVHVSWPPAACGAELASWAAAPEVS